MPRRFRMLLTLLAIVVGLYGAALAVLFSQQRRFLFPASSERTSATASGLPDATDVTLTTADGERVVAWWRPPEPGRAIVLYLHGNGGSLANRRDRAGRLGQDGRGLLLVSYRGYSGSTGTPSEAGLRLDAQAAYRFLSSFDPKRIVLYGESLGSAVAVRLASENPVAGVILDAPFTSVADVAGPLLPWVPVSMLLRDTFRSIDRIAAIGAPLLVLHGDRDGVIPIALGERLFAAAREPKRFNRLPGVDHVSTLEAGGLPAVQAFLAAVEASYAGSVPPG